MKLHVLLTLLQTVASACKKIEEGDEIIYVAGNTVVSNIL